MVPRGLDGGRRVFGLREARQLHLQVERQLVAQRLQRFGRQRALLEHLHLLKIEQVGFDDRLRLAEHIGEQELDGRQMTALGVEQQDVEDVLNVALGDVVYQVVRRAAVCRANGLPGPPGLFLAKRPPVARSWWRGRLRRKGCCS